MRVIVRVVNTLRERARTLTGIRENAALVRAGLDAPIARNAAKRLAALGGSQPEFSEVPRRRSA